ncbi:MAG: hypothetical protein CVU56_15965 [Deltaproteobacteria bacterium HGW-Deltaproteobacteria-14]|jgi:hypothetical protein|nr:MAG: hypothetical protein CVU56_15965 [Deltaproteobacteria bacterium HGW-Deltaproteobacteria-14]
MSIEPKLEEAVLAYLHGDGEEDPGALVTEGAGVEGFDSWLADLGAELRLYKRAVGADPERSDALGRLAALRQEVALYSKNKGQSGFASANDAPPAPISLDARRREKRRTFVFVGTLAALAAGILVAVMSLQGGPDAPTARPTVAQARQWVDALAPGGFSFVGEGPSAHDRGFLLGIVKDLAAPHADGTGATGDELATARDVALQALAGLGLGDDPDGALTQVLGGCAAFLKGPGDVTACERGRADYVRHRDAALAPAATGDGRD